MIHPEPLIPYIGITGIVNSNEALALVPAIPPYSNRKVMFGVLVSSSTLRGEPGRWPNRYPRAHDVAAVLPDHPAAFNVVHYNTDQPATLAAQLKSVVDLAGPNLHGFQLNLAWPSPGQLHQFLDEYPQQRIILQLNRESFQIAEGVEGGILTILQRDYRGLVSYALLDLSAGYGRPLDTHWARQQLLELYGADLGIGLGVAGGLSPDSLPLVAPLIEEFPGLSVDAEARLRDEDDNLDLAAAQEYLQMAFAMFNKGATNQ